MLHASTRKLIDRLSEMTELGKLDWTNDEHGNISYATEGYSVSLTKDPNEVVITSKDGKELERATVDEIAATEREDGTAYSAIVAAMMTEASRIARGTEAAISSLLAGMEDAPAEDPVGADADGAEALQEDVGDETTALSADPAETVAQDAPTEETVEETASEFASQDDETETETELVAADAPSSDDTDVDETPAEMDAEMDAAEDEAEASSDDDEQTEAAFIVASAEEDVTEAASEDSSLDEAQPEEIAVATETDSELETDPEIAPDTALEATDDADVETETDVSEAVARMANEVKHREDTGLETAAASAVGAVALAAGLTPQDSEPEAAGDVEAPALDADAFEEASEEPVEAIVAETAEPPAYVPFGLSDAEQDTSAEIAVEAEPEIEDEAETEMEVEAEPEVHAEPELVAEAAPPVETSIEPDVEDIASPIEALGQMADDTFATRAEAEPAEATPFTLDTEPVETEAPTPFFAETETVSEVEPVVEETLAPEADDSGSAAFTPFVAAEPSDVEPEPELATMDATPEPEAPVEQSYSLSGIGAGFGLGALSAKTEASGVPGPQSSSVETGEKVIIDATDDVLPKLEGNLNVSLAETASAAVSTANAATESSAPAEEADESDSDILKPRTRFNPWD